METIFPLFLSFEKLSVITILLLIASLFGLRYPPLIVLTSWICFLLNGLALVVIVVDKNNDGSVLITILDSQSWVLMRVFAIFLLDIFIYLFYFGMAYVVRLTCNELKMKSITVIKRCHLKDLINFK